MSCVASQGIVFCQFSPIGFVAVVFMVAMVGALIDRAVRFAVGAVR